MQFTMKWDGVKLNAGAFSQPALDKLIKQELLNTRARLIADTQAGNQANGGALKPYSMMYRVMIDSGRVQGKAPGNHQVNLTATGVLLRSLQIEKNDKGALLFFDGSHPPSRGVSDKGALAKRKKAQNKRSATLLGRAPKPVTVKAAKAGKTLSPLRPTGGSTRPLKALAADAKRIRKGTGGGGDIRNAAIAQFQYDIGRTGWMSFSRSKDLPRISAAVLKFINESAKKMIERTR